MENGKWKMQSAECRMQNAKFAGRFSFAFIGGDFRRLDKTENENHPVGRADSARRFSVIAKPNGKMDEKTLDSRILSDFKKQANKDFINSLGELLPTKMIEPFVLSLDIDPRKKVNTITKEERKLIVEKLKSFGIPLYRFRPIEEAIITSGGVNVKEVKPKTMESKIIDGLYFAGEILDVDGYTGGYNLQIAFSTGYLAGKSSAEY